MGQPLAQIFGIRRARLFNYWRPFLAASRAQIGQRVRAAAASSAAKWAALEPQAGRRKLGSARQQIWLADKNR